MAYPVSSRNLTLGFFLEWVADPVYDNGLKRWRLIILSVGEVIRFKNYKKVTQHGLFKPGYGANDQGQIICLETSLHVMIYVEKARVIERERVI